MSDLWDLAEPAELTELRARVQEAQERVEGYARQLELARELETRLQAILGAPSLPEDLTAMSPQRKAADTEATALLLKAELQAAHVLTTVGRETPGQDFGTLVISPELAATLAGLLEAMAATEQDLVDLARRVSGAFTTAPPVGGRGHRPTQPRPASGAGDAPSPGASIDEVNA